MDAPDPAESARLRELFELALDLKYVRRQGWIDRGVHASPESVADHSYSTALIASVYAGLAGLDARKAALMAVLHDIAESLTGDVTPGSTDAGSKRRADEEAMARVLSLVPAALRAEYEALWRELADKTSAEALIVRQADKLEMAMQARRYAREGRAGTEPFVASAREAVSDPALAAMIDECASERSRIR